jgi:hypothetical protein
LIPAENKIGTPVLYGPAIKNESLKTVIAENAWNGLFIPAETKITAPVIYGPPSVNKSIKLGEEQVLVVEPARNIHLIPLDTRIGTLVIDRSNVKIASSRPSSSEGVPHSSSPVQGLVETTGLLRDFGKTGLQFFPLGAGTIWLGRQWPTDNRNYTYPANTEINKYLDTVFAKMGNAQGVVLIDTAAAYGLSEEKLGEYFRSHPDNFNKAFIATKWG